MRHQSRLAGVQSVPRVMRGIPVARGPFVDVALSQRALAGLESQGLARTLSGLESQGLARTLGSLGGCTLGDEAGYPATTAAVIAPTNTNLQLAPAASARDAIKSASRTTLLLAAIAGAGLLYYASKRR